MRQAYFEDVVACDVAMAIALPDGVYWMWGDAYGINACDDVSADAFVTCLHTVQKEVEEMYTLLHLTGEI